MNLELIGIIFLGLLSGAPIRGKTRKEQMKRWKKYSEPASPRMVILDEALSPSFRCVGKCQDTSPSWRCCNQCHRRSDTLKILPHPAIIINHGESLVCNICFMRGGGKWSILSNFPSLARR